MRGRLQLTKLQQGKIATHIFQVLFVFIALCILIAMLTQGGHTDGGPFWYLALCFLSLPAWVFLIMTPMWERTVRFANAFVMAGVDIVFAIFWFAAFIALAVYKNAGEKKGAEAAKVSGSGNCTIFAYGPEKKCELANAAVGLGVVVWLLWIVSSGISIYFLIRWRKGEGLPWEDARPRAYPDSSATDANGKDAWSTDVIEPGEPGSDDGRHTPLHADSEDDGHVLLHSNEESTGHHPGTPWGPLSNDTSYHQSMPEETGYREPQRYAAPTALSPAAYSPHGGGYDDYRPGNHVVDGTRP